MCSWVGRVSPGVGAANAAPPPGSNRDGADGRVSCVFDDFVYFGGVVEMNNGRAEGEAVWELCSLIRSRDKF